MKYFNILVVGIALATSGVAEENIESESLIREFLNLKAKRGFKDQAPAFQNRSTVYKDQTEFRGSDRLIYLKSKIEPFSGRVIWKYSNKNWLEAHYLNGKRHGTYAQYREDGSKLFERPFIDGKLHGISIQYRESGLKHYEYHYDNGKLHGSQIFYREDGSKAKETLWENGKKISTK